MECKTTSEGFELLDPTTEPLLSFFPPGFKAAILRSKVSMRVIKLGVRICGQHLLLSSQEIIYFTFRASFNVT